MVGSLLYAAVSTRPDIAEAVGALAKFNACPTQTHLTTAKQVMRYLKGTKDLCLNFRKQGKPMVEYTDVDNASDADRHSKSGAVFINAGCSISWSSKRQSVVDLSTTESEYIALFDGVVECMRLRQLFSDIGTTQPNSTIIFVDNRSTAAITNSQKTSKRTKHIDAKNHYVREAIEAGDVCTEFRWPNDNIADIFMKPLPRDRFVKFKDILSLS
ncbi:uncharacterized protein [Watersipora subatra]|uniref:uncharacterized protein n=1 Tax=Watersipora subatra TaxID=2589382 RepID=UPI00355AD349